ncbi:helix-turn-helix transcriptional regulator [Streptomyces sp. DSM 41014]|uniref:Helix-turn-helix transcriptional regulator n=1 Tax=Streptomyces hintoniae TaxID=3075521 RepID=A0ABU2UXJ7_9ACTN|nr:helix-turn-helix transcriptional regulator [Streptomyces sp. DSM 41014]MDT0478026.1 helix-turn-helix transcriptional regulator [Streptomyces sp. DSM 41014]
MPVDAFAELLLQLRQDTGRTQEQQAAAINAASGRDTVTRREINRYEHGDNIPTSHTLMHIAVACGFSPDELLREAAAARARRRTAGRREGEDLGDVKRRTLLGGAMLGVASAAEPWSRLAHALGKGTKIDSAAVDTLIDRASALHVSERQLTAQELQGSVESHLDAITAVLPHAGTHEKALTVAAGETAALAGWVAWDVGDYARARAYYAVTSDCAESVGHPPLRALALAYASYGAATPAKAVELLAQAAQHVRGQGNATAAAWVHGRYAEEAASAGDGTGALRALDRARVAYDFSDYTNEQAWVRFVAPERIDTLALTVYGQLQHKELAETAKATARRLGDALPDSGVVILGDLAAALLRGGDKDQGAYVAQQFAAAVEARATTMGRDRARIVADRLPDRERELARHLARIAAA